MEELGSIWFYQESIDELRQKLQYTSFELEALKAKADEETRLHREEVKKLLHLLKLACQDRDEAKDQFQRLLKKQIATDHDNVLAMPPNPKVNSSITESNSLSLGSPPVDSFFEPVTSPEFSDLNNVADPVHGFGFGNQASDSRIPFSQNCHVSPSTVKIDPVDALIDKMVEGKALPVKGRLLKTVMESGPLLQTMLLAGPLPRWRNPPPLQQNFRVPRISDSYEVSRGCSLTSSSMLSFVGCSVSGIHHVPKRQRFH
ncbi:PREDICTED: uncharacterized protein LOC104815768 [Tarenaya hassleriana]|uniref:uncharacterized protein LOC104815768 n=1 Tax=Tarenaya hassleriana TaxID=28532 RepID=UPI00053C56AE|nr:PREDICTED: uncharacterized protein LOC104815768 [Tarenaya hassleriana]